MHSISFRAIAVIIVLSMLAGCAPWHAYSHKVEPADLSQLKTFYVLHNKDDTGGLDNIVQEALESLGLEATTGGPDRIPDDIDALVTYEFHWFWDLATYLLMLKILIRNPENEWPLAMGESVRPSLARKPPADMAMEILLPLFNPTASPAKKAAQ